jgi:hypothetical protein
VAAAAVELQLKQTHPNISLVNALQAVLKAIFAISAQLRYQEQMHVINTYI